MTLAQLTAKTKNLRAYVDLAKTVGPRARQDKRGAGSQLSVMAGGPMGGQLVQVLKDYYLSPAQAATAIDLLFMANRMEDFFRDTTWPYPYEISYTQFFEYAFDLTRRATWQRATRQDWAALVQPILPAAIAKLGMVEEIMRDIMTQPATLVREVERLGDALLTGDQTQKMVFWKLSEIDKELRRSYAEAVREQRAEGKDSAEIVQNLIDLISPTSEATGTRGQLMGEGRMEEIDAGPSAPKRGQIKRAMAEASFQRLEQGFLATLQSPGQPDKDVMELLKECFQARSVLAKAVLLQTRGIRVNVFTHASDFLDLVKDERRSLPLYFGQCMAYDKVIGRVPDALRTFSMDPGEVLRLTNFEWEHLDPLNLAILKIQGEMGGSSYGAHDVGKLYYHGDLITKLGQVYGQLFQGLGFPPWVESSAGLTFNDFVDKLKGMQEFSLSLSEEEGQRLLELTTHYAKEGFSAAAAYARVNIYGACPADRFLGPWLIKDEPLLLRLDETLEQAMEVARYRRAMPNIFERRPTERMYPGFGEKGRSGKPREEVEDKPARGKKATTDKLVKTDDKDKGYAKEQAIRQNVRKVFMYDDESFSMKTRLFKWKGICEHFGWDHDKHCAGPWQ